MKPTDRNNDHLRSDDEHTHTHSPIPLIDSAHLGGWAEGKSRYMLDIFVCGGVKTFLCESANWDD